MASLIQTNWLGVQHSRASGRSETVATTSRNERNMLGAYNTTCPCNRAFVIACFRQRDAKERAVYNNIIQINITGLPFRLSGALVKYFGKAQPSFGRALTASNKGRHRTCLLNDTTVAVFYCENQQYASMLDFSPDRRKKKVCSVNQSLSLLYMGQGP
jgi:hypothetical protein